MVSLRPTMTRQNYAGATIQIEKKKKGNDQQTCGSQSSCPLTSAAQFISIRGAACTDLGAGPGVLGTGISILASPSSLDWDCDWGCERCQGCTCCSDATPGSWTGTTGPANFLQHVRTVHMIRLMNRWIPNTRNWDVSRKPAMNDMTSTAVGDAVHAAAKRKPMSASAEMNMQTVGRRQVRQKKKYEPYTSFARRYSEGGQSDIRFSSGRKL